MKHSHLSIREWDEDEFFASRDAYTDLLHCSSADPLFLSWDWLTLWWTHFGNANPGRTLTIHAANDNDRLVGALPVVSGVRANRRFLRYTTSSVLGNFFRSGQGIPTEYLDIVSESGREQETLTACLRAHLRCSGDSEFSIGWTHASARWRTALESVKGRPWSYVRSVDPLTAYNANLSEGFEAYTQKLSGNSRRAVFNLRRRLAEAGELTVRPVAEARIPDALAQLNALHALRWGNPAFVGPKLEFHRALIGRLAPLAKVVAAMPGSWASASLMLAPPARRIWSRSTWVTMVGTSSLETA